MELNIFLFHNCCCSGSSPNGKGINDLNDLDMIFHQIRVKLYPNYLKNVEGTYIARTDNDKTLSIEDICTIMKTRSGFSGKYEDLLDHIRQYYDEVAYQLCDGYAVSNGYYSIHPNIGGTFDSVNEAHNHEKHPIGFRFGTRAKLSNLVKNIVVDVAGFGDGSGYIDKFTDYEEDSVNNIFFPGNQFAIHGHKIKLEGEDPGVGVYFVPVADPSKAVKVERIAENSPTRITGIAPDTEHQYNRIEIRTQFSGNPTRLLKAPRTIISTFTLETA